MSNPAIVRLTTIFAALAMACTGAPGAPEEATGSLGEAFRSCSPGYSWQCEPGLGGKLVCGCEADPAPPPPPLFALEVVASTTQSCAVMSDATLRCWGQTWDGTPDPGPTVPILSNVAHVAASPESHNLCFIMTDGTFQCTGPNSVLNISTAIDPTLAGVRAVAFGEYDACAIVRDGSVRCWGDGEIVGSPGLSAPTGIVNATSIAVATSPGGTGNLCALTGTGAVLCQGNDQHPAVVVAVPVSGISFLTASVYGSFAATPLDGSSPMEWTALPGQSPTLPVPDGLTNIRSLSLGFTSPPFVPVTYAVDFGGNLWAVSQAAVPTQLAAARFAAVSAGALHQCALGLDGQVYCWGDNSRGQLGGSSLTVPVRF